MDRLGLFLYFVLTVGGSVVYRLVFVKNTESGQETRKKEVCIRNLNVHPPTSLHNDLYPEHGSLVDT